MRGRPTILPMTDASFVELVPANAALDGNLINVPGNAEESGVIQTTNTRSREMMPDFGETEMALPGDSDKYGGWHPMHRSAPKTSVDRFHSLIDSLVDDIMSLSEDELRDDIEEAGLDWDEEVLRARRAFERALHRFGGERRKP